MKLHVGNSDLLFVGKKGDTLAEQGLRYLTTLGFKTLLLTAEEHAPLGSIAFYSVGEWPWTSKVLREAAHRVYENRPEWTITTPFLVEIRKNCPKGNLENAFVEAARKYVLWFRGQTGACVPWESKQGQHTTYTNLLEGWFDLVEQALGPEKARVLIAEQRSRDQIIGRGGDIVFNRLGDTMHVVTKREDLPVDLVANRAYENLRIQAMEKPFQKPVVSYGTSDVANLFELLQAIKLGYVLGLPVMFETYPSAHDWGYWVTGFLNPSLANLGPVLAPGMLSLDPTGKYTQVIKANEIKKVLLELGLTNVAEMASSWANVPLWKFYHKAMRVCAMEMLQYAGVADKVIWDLTTFEQICQQTPYWEMNARKLAVEIAKNAGHEVNFLNAPSGVQIRTSQPYSIPNVTISELHEQGYWLGGAVIYDLIFSLGNQGGVVVMVKDSTAGAVNMLARPYMLAPNSGLYLAPVGLFRLTASGQNEDWSIDPLVMLELIYRWGPSLARLELKKIWDAMEIPLKPEHIGRKTVATVTTDGVQIDVRD